MFSKRFLTIVFLLLSVYFTLPLEGQDATSTPETKSGTRMILATTTSTNDSGLLDYILPVFEKTYNVKVDVVAVGTGQALELGQNGDADVELVHARSQEDKFVTAGYGTERFDVMYNDFIIIGPVADPAGVKNANSAVDAFKLIADTGAKGNAVFISRGDNSGTFTKEQAIWKAAKITPEGNWYESAGQGMGAVLNMSSEQQAYTLSDRATYLARQAQGLELPILYQGGEILYNPYGVIPVNPEKRPLGDSPLPEQFAHWLTSVETQQLIASYEINGQQLFFPDSVEYLAMQATATAESTLEATPESTPSS